MPKKQNTDTDTIVYVRLSSVLARKLDRRVARERKKKGDDVPGDSISRSSIIRSAVVKMLEDAT